MSESTAQSSAQDSEPPQALLEELCAKFILTAPKDALQSKEKIFFLVEQAWWYYEDKVRLAFPNLKHYASYATFAEPLFRKCEALSPMRPNLQSHLEDYRRYKQGIPVFGAILLDAAMEQVLLVRGNKSSMGWGFPRGKLNEGEAEADCAVREVLEETGYDIGSQLRPHDYLEVTSDGKRHKLYIVAGLDPETQQFEPHSKWEIGAYAWHRVAALPATLDEASQVYKATDGVRHRFFMIHPFVGRLRRWIEKRQRQAKQQPSMSTASSTASSLQIPQSQVAQMLAAAPGAAAQQQQQQQQPQLLQRPQPEQKGSRHASPSPAASAAARQQQQQQEGQQKLHQQAQQHAQQHQQAQQQQAQQQQPRQQGRGRQAPAPAAKEVAAAAAAKEVAATTAAAAREVAAAAAAAAVDAGEPWYPSMSNFRFDRAAIMRCFATPA